MRQKYDFYIEVFVCCAQIVRLGSFHNHIHIHSLLSEVHLVDIEIDVKAEKTLVFNFVILRDHKNIFLLDQVIDSICYFFSVLSCLLNSGSRILVDHYLFDDLIDDFWLLDRLLAVALHLLERANNEHGHPLVLFECDFDISSLWLLLALLGLFLFSLHTLNKKQIQWDIKRVCLNFTYE